MKKVFSHSVLLFVLLLLSLSVFAQEMTERRIELKNGTILTGIVVLQSDGSYLVELKSGDVIFFQATEVSRIVDDARPSTSLVPDRIDNPPVLVDLGLSVKWADKNVGALYPSNYGGYYAWGESSTKTNYRWASYKYCDGGSTKLNKYNSSNRKGEVDNKYRLDLEDDVANLLLGDGWRIPTHEEWEELIDYCVWKWEVSDGIKGYKVTSPRNGNSIFLPAGGYWNGASISHKGQFGRYWSSSLSIGNPDEALRFYFASKSYYIGSAERYYGYSIRAVKE